MMRNLFLISLLVSSFFVQSQEVPDPIRAEYLMCNLKEGKSFSDMSLSEMDHYWELSKKDE